MTWFKVDDSFYDHPKVFDAPDCALALWVRAGSWSARNLTDGFVPANMPARLCDDPDTAVKELIDRGLWRRTKRGYQFHDWTVYQPSREEVERDRAAAAERQRRRRARLMNAALAAVRKTRKARAKKAGGRADYSWEPDYLTGKHPLARKARRLCDAREHTMRRRIGETACGQCWETAIREDERTVIAAQERA